jgi:TM2 domain-containing membrane protein YozV
MTVGIAIQDAVHCRDCGIQIARSARACPHCGGQQIGTGTEKNRIVAALLALFLGGFGVHRFYLGRSGSGVLYLLFFWTFIPAILALIEFVRLLLMSEETFHQKYT